MSDPARTLAQRVSFSFIQLNKAAADLNAVSDQLGKHVAEIDTVLKRLNLGITVWVQIWGWSGDGYQNDYSYQSEDLGYAKVDGKWGISLRRVAGDATEPDREKVEVWPFNDGSRTLRLASISHIPELIEKLSAEAVNTTVKIQERLADVKAVAVAMKEIK